MTKRKRTARTKMHRAAAYREAGHAVAAWNRRIMLKPISIFRNGSGSGKNAWNNTLKNVDVEWTREHNSPTLVERLASVCLCGPLAQRKLCPEGPRGPVYKRRIQEARTLVDNTPGTPGDRRARYENLAREADRFLDRRGVRDAVTALAEALLEEGTMTGDEAEQLIEKHQG